MKVNSLQDHLDNFEEEFQTLKRFCDSLSSSLNLKTTLNQLLQVLAAEFNLQKAIVSVKHADSSESHIESSYNFSTLEIASDSFSKWVLLNREVLLTGELKIITDIPFSDFSFEDGVAVSDVTFLCFPLTVNGEGGGTLSIFTVVKNDAQLQHILKLCAILSLMISQEVAFVHLMANEQQELVHENIKLKHELQEKYNIHNMVGTSNAMLQVYESIMQVANSTASVLIRGPSGTGKELVAQAIHYNSTRHERSFIKINCGAIPESLIESELFGYEKGAFTDASSLKMGKFEAADGGTIFLDEIAELSPALQVKLLRVLQEKEIVRVGGIDPISVDVRVITATNKNLEQEMIEKKFRQDLYYRLNVFPIFIPPLKERSSDILLLAEHFLAKFSKQNKKSINRISSLAINLLNSYHWPGNVRELENCIERAVIICQTDSIQASDLPPTLQKVEITEAVTKNENEALEERVQRYEKEIILEALKQSKGNIAKSARRLKTTQRILGYKISQLGIEPKKFKRH